MAATITYPSKGIVKVSWDALTSGSKDGDIVDISRWPDRTVQFRGSFNTATVELLGSMATATGTFVTIDDADGVGIITTTTGIFLVRENPQYIMPSVVSTGTGTSVSINVDILANG